MGPFERRARIAALKYIANHGDRLVEEFLDYNRIDSHDVGVNICDDVDADEISESDAEECIAELKEFEETEEDFWSHIKEDEDGARRIKASYTFNNAVSKYAEEYVDELESELRYCVADDWEFQTPPNITTIGCNIFNNYAEEMASQLKIDEFNGETLEKLLGTTSGRNVLTEFYMERIYNQDEDQGFRDKQWSALDNTISNFVLSNRP